MQRWSWLKARVNTHGNKGWTQAWTLSLIRESKGKRRGSGMKLGWSPKEVWCYKREQGKAVILGETWGFPCGSVGKEPACNAGDLCSIPALERSPGEGNGYPAFWPVEFHWLYSPWGRKESDTTERLSPPPLSDSSCLLLWLTCSNCREFSVQSAPKETQQLMTKCHTDFWIRFLNQHLP